MILFQKKMVCLQSKYKYGHVTGNTTKEIFLHLLCITYVLGGFLYIFAQN